MYRAYILLAPAWVRRLRPTDLRYIYPAPRAAYQYNQHRAIETADPDSYQTSELFGFTRVGSVERLVCNLALHPSCHSLDASRPKFVLKEYCLFVYPSPVQTSTCLHDTINI